MSTITRWAIASPLGMLLALLASAALAASSPAPAPTLTGVSAWAAQIKGDSLAIGFQDGGSVDLATAMQADFGFLFVDDGISSQKSTQIAMRQGGVPVLLTFTGNQITSTYNTITAINGVSLASMGGMSTNQDPDYRFLNFLGSDGNLYQWGTVCGVHGQLNGAGTGGPPSTAIQYQFLPDVAGQYPIACAAQSNFVPDTAANNSQPTIIVAGRNNNGQLAQVESDIAAMTAVSPNNLVFSIINGETEPAGSSAYNTIIADNTALAAIYGNHFLDWRSILIAQANLSDPADAYDHTNGIPPWSMRAAINTGTLNGALNSTATTIPLTPLYAGVSAGVMKVDSEYISCTGVSGNSLTGCTRGYGTGGVAATHLSGADYVIKDNLHVSGAADAIVAAAIKASPTAIAALFGQTQVGHVTGAATGAAFTVPQQINAMIQFNKEVFVGNTLYLTGCLHTFNSGISGPENNLLCYNGGTGVITLGGAYNTGICFNVGGAPTGCQASAMQAGFFSSKGGFADASCGATPNTTATSGSTVVIPAGTACLVLNAGALAALTVQLPGCYSNAFNGNWIFHLSTTGTITALTFTTASGSVASNASPGTVARNTAVICMQGVTEWFPY